jgi:hypothetical protein
LEHGETFGFGGADVHIVGSVDGHEGIDGAVGEEPGLADHDHVVGGESHLAHQVREHRHRASLGGERAQQGADPLVPVGVEPVDRLVADLNGAIA